MLEQRDVIFWVNWGFMFGSSGSDWDGIFGATELPPAAWNSEGGLGCHVGGPGGEGANHLRPAQADRGPIAIAIAIGSNNHVVAWW